MATITVKGTPTQTIGELPARGTKAPDFVLTRADLSDVGLGDFAGKKKVLNIVTSLDTSTCAVSAKRFDEAVKTMPDTVILTISNDLPFAQNRFCSAESVDNVITLSQLRNRDFGVNYGVAITDGPLAGLLARSVVVLDADDTVVYTQQVSENSQEPDYEKAIAAAR
ncbi:MAG: thiol peroxidase [Spirochaetaceae bacterium]|nr:MAG: thiol peroxidase [Spirochaetaceae bacterium]